MFGSMIRGKGNPHEHEKARILVVDDYEVVRTGLKNMLSENAHWQVCGEADNGQKAIEKVAELGPDVVFLDVSMPVMNGLDAAREIRRMAPRIKIVIFTMHESSQMAAEARRAGADTFLPKNVSPDVLEKTIAALLGEGYAS
jgi:DNA-binding NarL/FixJ family response regulator